MFQLSGVYYNSWILRISSIEGVGFGFWNRGAFAEGGGFGLRTCLDVHKKAGYKGMRMYIIYIYMYRYMYMYMYMYVCTTINLHVDIRSYSTKA